jgi:hypothetical protein
VGIAALASSYVTVAVLCSKEITTSLTPGTAARLPFTICGQAEQVMFSTESVTVFSAAKAAVLSRRIAEVAALRSLCHEVVSKSSGENEGGNEIESDRRCNKERRGNERDGNHPVGQWPGASRAFRADCPTGAPN